MMLGPPKILECSSCKNYISDPTYLSWNTFGSTLWSDGKTESPMAPQELQLVKCRHCQTLIWIDDLPVVFDPRETGSDNEEKEFLDARPASNPSFQEYVDLLSRDLSDEQVRYVRIHAWWIANDRRRGKKEIVELSAPETDNLLALVSLLDERDGHERIMKAEALRELGGFSAAQRLLEMSFTEQLQEVAVFLGELNKQKNKAVTAIGDA